MTKLATYATTEEVIAAMKSDATLLVSLRTALRNAREWMAKSKIAAESVDSIVCLADGMLCTIRITESGWTRIKNHGKVC